MNKCEICGHKWRSRTDRKPRACPACKRYNWDKKKT